MVVEGGRGGGRLEMEVGGGGEVEGRRRGHFQAEGFSSH